MKRYGIYVLAIGAMVAGCVSEPQAPDTTGTADAIVAEMVAGTVGYNGNGLVAVVNDLSSIDIRRAELPVGNATPFAFVPAVDIQTVAPAASSGRAYTFTRRRDQGDVISEWSMNYALGERTPTQPETVVQGATVNVAAHTDGTFRNSRLTIQGESKAEFILQESKKVDMSNVVNGTYRYAGNIDLRAYETGRYDDVTIEYTWDRLTVSKQGNSGYRSLTGRVEISISANGPNGIITRSGSLTLDGSDKALLNFGDKQFMIHVRAAICIGN